MSYRPLGPDYESSLLKIPLALHMRPEPSFARSRRPLTPRSAATSSPTPVPYFWPFAAFFMTAALMMQAPPRRGR